MSGRGVSMGVHVCAGRSGMYMSMCVCREWVCNGRGVR